MKLGVLKIIIIVVTGVCPVYIGCFYLWPKNWYPWVGMVSYIRHHNKHGSLLVWGL